MLFSIVLLELLRVFLIQLKFEIQKGCSLVNTNNGVTLKVIISHRKEKRSQAHSRYRLSIEVVMRRQATVPIISKRPSNEPLGWTEQYFASSKTRVSDAIGST